MIEDAKNIKCLHIGLSSIEDIYALNVLSGSSINNRVSMYSISTVEASEINSTC